jgi:hypothetical protein
MGAGSAESARGAEGAEGAGPAADKTDARPAERRPVQSGTLTAGDIDDNLNFEDFVGYASRFTQGARASQLPAVPLADRVTLQVSDAEGRPVSNARVTVTGAAGNGPALRSYAGTDGVFRIFPAADGLDASSGLNVTVAGPDGGGATDLMLDPERLQGPPHVDVTLAGAVGRLPSAIDLMFVIDATGSMSDEMQYLSREFTDIIGFVERRFGEVAFRFGLVVYRDKGDEYVVRGFDFTDSGTEMQRRLAKERAGGGGDYPEAMDQGMKAGIEKSWSKGNSGRLLFLVADAPPHDGRMGATMETFRAARRAGIRVHPIAASGVADGAEYIMRHGAVLTHGRYLFLTDDSGVGDSHKEPSIPGYVVTRLDQLVARVIVGELAGRRIEPDEGDIIRRVGHYDAGYVRKRAAEDHPGSAPAGARTF